MDLFYKYVTPHFESQTMSNGTSSLQIFTTPQYKMAAYNLYGISAQINGCHRFSFRVARELILDFVYVGYSFKMK